MKHVTESAVIRRINRRNPGQHVGQHSGPYTRGRFYCSENGVIVAETNDLEAWARECGALAPTEVIA
jgi:hypothetical protein